jgi:hypothetical protein
LAQPEPRIWILVMASLLRMAVQPNHAPYVQPVNVAMTITSPT